MYMVEDPHTGEKEVEKEKGISFNFMPSSSFFRANSQKLPKQELIVVLVML